MNDNLNKLIEKFVSLPQEEKSKEIINHLKENIAMYLSLCRQYGYNDDLILNREMLYVVKENATIDDYYEAIYAYLRCLEDISGKFLNNYLRNK